MVPRYATTADTSSSREVSQHRDKQQQQQRREQSRKKRAVQRDSRGEVQDWRSTTLLKKVGTLPLLTSYLPPLSTTFSSPSQINLEQSRDQGDRAERYLGRFKDATNPTYYTEE